MPFLVVYGFEAFEDAAATGVVGTPVGLVHDGEDVLHFAVETVALAVGELLGHALVIFLRGIGAALDGLVGAVVDASAYVVVVLSRQTACYSQEKGEDQNLLIFHNILTANVLYVLLDVFERSFALSKLRKITGLEKN